MNYTTLSVLLLCFCSVHGNILGPYQGVGNRRSANPSPQNPSCVMLEPQDSLPETVQLITYGAPEVSAFLAMGLTGKKAHHAHPKE